MAVNYTPIVNGSSADATTFNTPLQELDDAIENVRDGTLAMSAPDITSFANAAHDHTDAANGGQIPFDAIDTGAATDGQFLRVQSGAVVAETVGFIPAGAFIPYGGAVAPTGWLLCDGSAVSRITYADLFTAIGTAFGVGDGSTTFNLPDFRGRALAGLDNMGGVSAGRVGAAAADSMGGAIGTETHTLTEAQMPTHRHTINYPSGGVGSNGLNTGGLFFSTGGGTYTTDTMNTTGGSQPHNNMQPTMFVNWLIKV